MQDVRLIIRHQNGLPHFTDTAFERFFRHCFH